MDIKGKIEFISTLEKGTDKNGKEFEKAYFVLNDGIGQYPNKYKIELFNKTDLMRGVAIGSEITVSINSSVNEWKEKHYCSLSAYKIEKVGMESVAPTQEYSNPNPTNAPAPTPTEDGMPF